MAVSLLSRKFVFTCGVVIISPKSVLHVKNGVIGECSRLRDRRSSVRGVMKPSLRGGGNEGSQVVSDIHTVLL